MGATVKEGKTIKGSTTKHDAAIFLTSAIFYAQDAGIEIGYGNEDGKLILVFDGLDIVSLADGKVEVIQAGTTTNT